MSNELTPASIELESYKYMAKTAALSRMYKGIGDETGLMMIMLTARELGLPAMQALNGGINIIQGKVELSARLMNALMRRAGISIKIKKSTDDECILVGKRSDNGDEIEASYSIEDAKRAGLVKSGGGWVKFPKDMCFARAISRLARQIAPDIIGACYVEGEIRPADTPILQETEITPVETDPTEKRNLILDKIEPHLHDDMKKYILVVMEHFNWTEEETLDRFIKDDQLINKFQNWLLKMTKREEP